jgi:hypothetical protein
MNNRYRHIDRRGFLKAMGVGVGILPFLEAERVSGQVLGDPKRMMFLAWSNGMLNGDRNWPGTGTDYVLPSFMDALEPHREEIILVSGIYYRAVRESTNISERTGHAAFPCMLTGALYQGTGGSTANDVAGGPSLDQYIGNSLRGQGYGGLTSLNLGVKVDSNARLAWRGAGDAIVPEEDPYEVFNDLFAGALAEPGDTPDPEVVRIIAMRESILDYVAGDLGRFSAGLGAADRQRIDAHLTSIRELELKLQVTQNLPINGELFVPEFEQGVNVGSTLNLRQVTEMHMQLSAAAFAADVTRAIVLQIGDQGGSNLVLTDLGFDANNNTTEGNTGLVEGLHVIAHENGADKAQTDSWFQDRIAYMIQLLKDTADGTGALIDSTVFLSMSNMRDGNHNFDDVPAVLAGNMGGYFDTGKSIEGNANNNSLLVSIANAVGVETETFGEASFGGELTGLRG